MPEITYSGIVNPDAEEVTCDACYIPLTGQMGYDVGDEIYCTDCARSLSRI